MYIVYCIVLHFLLQGGNYEKIFSTSFERGHGIIPGRTIYDEASKKTSELQEMDIETTAAMTMTQGDQTIDLSTTMDIQMTGANTDDMKYLAAGKTTMAGQDIDVTMYYEGGYYYMETMGQKIKYAMDLNQLMEQVKQSTEGANMESS